MADFPTSKKTWADLVDNVSPANSSDINSAYAEITAIEDAFLTDSTSLNASTDTHGFLPKLSGTATEFLDGTGAWSTPPGGGGESSDLIEHGHTGSTDGGVIKLDTISAPTDVTTLNASTDAHGLLPKLDGTSDNYLNGKGEWSTPAGGTAGGVREMLTADRTYYVRTDGNDSNDGLSNTSGGAFLTIQYAIDVAASLDTSIYSVTIQIADGTYVSGEIICKNILGAGNVTIQGNNSAPANVVIDSGFAKTTPGTKYIVKDLKLQKSSSSVTQALAASGGAILDYGNLVFGTGYTTHISCGTYASITCIGNYAISGAASYHLYSSGYATISMGGKTVTISGTPAFTVFCIASSKATVVAVTITWSGSATGQRYLVNIDGLVNTGGGGANYFPGNSAGDATGGTYI